MRRVRVGIFGPAGSDPSGVAKYVDKSASVLADHYDVTVFGSVPQADVDVDVSICHLGNNRMHRSAFERLAGTRAIAVMHEYLHLDYYFQAWPFVGAGRRKEILDLLASRNDNEPLLDLEDYFARCRSRQLDPYSADVGVERFAVREAQMTLFHSAHVAGQMALRYPEADIATLPFPVERWSGEKPLPLWSGVPANAFVFATFGFIGEYKSVEQIIAAWNGWRERPADAWLLLVGSRQYDIEYQGTNIIETGYVSDSAFEDLLAAVDCGIQLRAPSLGETSAPAAWLAAHGRRRILSDIPEMRGLGNASTATFVKNDSTLVRSLIDAYKQAYQSAALGTEYSFDSTFSWSNWRRVFSAHIERALDG